MLALLRRPIHASMQMQRSFTGSGSGSSRWTGGWSRSSFWSSAAMAATSATMGTALCAPRDKDIREEQSTGINLIIDTLMPLSQQLTMGALMGYTSGYALRVVGQMAAVSVGVAFMALQGAAYSGYVDVNWNKTTKDLKSLLDVDGNGEFDSNDAKIILMKFIEICTFNLPSGAGFSGGLALGLGFGGRTAGKAAAVVGTATLIPRVLMMGGAATAGSGAMVTLKEQYDVARRDAGELLNRTFPASGAKQGEEAIFTMALQGMDLESLRNMEKGYTLQMQRAKDKGERDDAASRLAAIEERKKALKKAH